jgi:hypothetical protein
MSYSNNNNRPDTGYPTAPTKQPKSPWFYVGMGCLGLFVLSFGTCATIGVIGFNKVKSEMAKPLDKETLKQELAGIPEYPNATLDEQATKAMRAGTGLMSFAMQGKKMMMAAYDTKEPASDIIAWYDTKMTEAGYESSNADNVSLKKYGISVDTGGTARMVRMFVKDTEMVQIQAQSKKDTKKNVLMIMRFTGFTKAEMKEIKK